MKKNNSIYLLFICILFLTGCIKFTSVRKLTLYCLNTEKVLYEKLITEYQKIEPEVEINILSFDEKEYEILDIIKNKSVDLLSLPSEFHIKDIGSENFLELGNLINSDEIIINKNESDEIYYISLNGSIPVLISDLEFLRQENLFVPSSFEEFKSVGITLKESNPITFYVSDKEYETLELIADSLLLNNPLEKKAIVYEDNSINMGFYNIEDLYYAMGLDKTENNEKEANEILQKFINKKSPILVMSSDRLNEIQISDEYTVSPFPSGDLFNYIPFKSGMRLAILKKSKNQNETEKFLEFLLSNSAQDIIYKETGKLPVNKDVELKENLKFISEYINTYSDIRNSFFESVLKSEKDEAMKIIIELFNGKYNQDTFAATEETSFIGSIESIFDK